MKNTCILILLFLFHINVSAQSDCVDAIIVCGNANYRGLNATGIGIQELQNTNPCSSLENNSLWLKILIDDGGTLGFVITPDSDDLVVDFDFWMFGPDTNCGNLGTTIRCSTTNPLQAGATDNLTGMTDLESDIAEGPGPDGNSFINWITVQDNETYYLVIDRPHGASDFSLTWTGTATFYEVPVFNNPNNIPLDLSKCDNDGVDDQQTAFDLTVHSEMFIGDQQNVEITYHLNLNDMTVGENPIASPENFVNNGNPQTIFLRMTNLVTGCYDTQTFNIIVLPGVDAATPDDLIKCDTGNTGVQPFNLSALNTEIANGEAGLTITYHTTLAAATADTGAIINPAAHTNIQSPGQQTIFARAERANGCFDIVEFNLIVNPLPVANAIEYNSCEIGPGEAAFDLHSLDDEITVVSGNISIQYYETLTAAQNGAANFITDNPYISGSQTIYVRVENTDTDCVRITTIELHATTLFIADTVGPIIACDDNNSPDGSEVFDLTSVNSEINPDNGDLVFTYHISNEDALAGTNSIQSPQNFSNTQNPQEIFVRLENEEGCFDTVSFILIVNPLPVVNLALEPLSACEEVPGQGLFNLHSLDALATLGIDGYLVTYHETPEEAKSGEGALESPYLSAEKTVSIRVEDEVTGCFSLTSVDLLVLPAPLTAALDPLEVCDVNNDLVAEFALSTVVNYIMNTMGNIVVSVFETEADAVNNAQNNKIQDLDSYSNIVTQTNNGIQTVYVRVGWALNECFDVVPLQLIVHPTPDVETPSPYHVCDLTNDDGVGTFNLDSKTAEILGANDPLLYTVTYHGTLSAAQNGIAAINNTSNYNSQQAIIYVRVTDNATGCFTIVELELVVNALPAAIPPLAYSLCDENNPGDEREVFDLTSRISEILGSNTQEYIVEFYDTYADAETGNSPIINPQEYTNQETVETIFTAVINPVTGCRRIVLLDVRVEPLPLLSLPLPDDSRINVCDPDANGFASFDLESLVDDLINNGEHIEISFHETQQDADNNLNAIPNPENYTNVFPVTQTIYVRALNTDTGCVRTIDNSFVLTVIPSPQVPNLTDITLCDEEDTNNQDGQVRFDLTQQNAAITAALGAGYTIEYFTTLAAAQQGAPRIINETTFNGVDGQEIWVRVEYTTTECFGITSFQLFVNTPLALTAPPQFTQCNEALPNNGQGTFDLTTQDAVILGAFGQGQGNTVTYYVTQADVDSNTPIANPQAFVNTLANPQTLQVVVTTTDGCRSYTTLTVKELPLPTPNTTPATLAQCDNDTDGEATFDLTQAEDDIRDNETGTTITYHETLEDAQNDTNAIANPTSHTMASGIIYVRVEANTGNANDEVCYVVVELPVQVDPLPVLGTAGAIDDMAFCEEELTGFHEFNLASHYGEIILGMDSNDFIIRFYKDQAAILSGMAMPLEYTNEIQFTQAIWVVVINRETGCKSQGTFNLIVEQRATSNPVSLDFIECDYDDINDGIYTFDITSAGTQALGNQDAATHAITYYPTLADAEAGTNEITNPASYRNLIPDVDTVWIKIINAASLKQCPAYTSFQVYVERLPEPVLQNGTVCIDTFGTVISPFVLNAGLDDSHTFVWYKDGQITNATGSEITVMQAGSYSVIATSASGCISQSVTAIIGESGPAELIGTGYTVTAPFSENPIITIFIQGSGTYLYSLDNGAWQESNVFVIVLPGNHSVRVKDAESDGYCGELSIPNIMVIDYPRFFTPNGDNDNEQWGIEGLAPDAMVAIFDRYGKLITGFYGNEKGWDGTLNGRNLPATDYWFTITFKNGQIFRAHFALLR